ncbi:MAG TPA: GNAT family N-acetyltransferase [Microlunatus sp.]|nr:GNAT family N-acetyltransferase [Microlunatus sp.]
MFELRPRPYDHPDVQQLTERAQAYYVEIYGGPDEDPLKAAEFVAPRGGFVVGYLDGAAVAMGGWTFTADDRGDRVAKIRRMFVDAAVRRHGLARKVLWHLETEAARHGATMIILATGQPQTAAIAFYRSHGYTDIAPFGYYADGDQVVCLGRELGAQPTS